MFVGNEERASNMYPKLREWKIYWISFGTVLCSLLISLSTIPIAVI
jgi:hypothetical protein